MLPSRPSMFESVRRIYRDGFHVCNDFYGQRREQDEECMFCDELLYRSRHADSKVLRAVSHGKLYLVATPIGNLDDMDFSCYPDLERSRLIAAEDTRNTGLCSSILTFLLSRLVFMSTMPREKIPDLDWFP